MDISKFPQVSYTTNKDAYKGKSPVNNAWDAYLKTGKKPLQWAADKYAKNKAWKLIKAKWDFDNKSMTCDIMTNADDYETINVSYEDICKEMRWKSFEIVNENSCIPIDLTIEEEKAMYEDAIKKTAAADAVLLKEEEKKQSKSK